MSSSSSHRDSNYERSADGLVTRMRRAWGESPFYQARLRGPAPDRLLTAPEDPFTPDPEFAKSFVYGKLSLGDEFIDCEQELWRLWDMVRPGSSLHSFTHEFAWLRHLGSLGPEGRKAAHVLTESWLERYEKWSVEAWDPYLAAERLVQLCAHHKLILKSSDALWRSRVLSAMARQTRHLAHSAHKAGNGFDRLMSSLGLCIAGYCLPGCEAAGDRGVEMAHRELRLQLRADGGHVSRNPSRQLKLAVRLQQALAAIDARKRTAPGFLRHSVVRASVMAAFFRVGDGKLAVFNGGYEDDPKAVLFVNKVIDPDGIPTDFARHSGYHRLSSGRSVVIVDTGNDLGAQQFKSAGSFQFSSGRARIFINCGNGGHRASEWRKALVLPAAHSTVSFEAGDQGAPLFDTISHWRAEDPNGRLVEFERSIGADPDGAVYRRRLFLSLGGGDLRGDEHLTGAGLNAAKAVWRFHLHPAIRASVARDRRSVILLTPSKEGWRFKVDCSELSIEKSVYCGEGDAPISSEQIVINGADARPGRSGGVQIKWALKRLDPA